MITRCVDCNHAELSVNPSCKCGCHRTGDTLTEKIVNSFQQPAGFRSEAEIRDAIKVMRDTRKLCIERASPIDPGSVVYRQHVYNAATATIVAQALEWVLGQDTPFTEAVKK